MDDFLAGGRPALCCAALHRALRKSARPKFEGWLARIDGGRTRQLNAAADAVAARDSATELNPGPIPKEQRCVNSSVLRRPHIMPPLPNRYAPSGALQSLVHSRSAWAIVDANAGVLVSVYPVICASTEGQNGTEPCTENTATFDTPHKYNTQTWP